MNTTADGRIVPDRSYDRNFTATSPPTDRGNGDRSYSLTSAQQRRSEDRSYTLGADRNYPPSRSGNSAVAQPRRPEEGRSMTMSGRMSGNNTSPTMDFARPIQPRQQIAPGSPRRPPPTSASSRSAAALGGVREEGSETAVALPSILPPITTSVSGRHESVDSAYSDMDSALVPQRTKSSSSFPLVSPSTAGTDRRPSLTKPPSSQPSISRNRAPIVYPALLSRVALALRERITLGDKQKDGLTYPNAFTGSEAVDLITYVIKTSDRNLALLLGRALDAQRWFHDVTYVHRYFTSTPSLIVVFEIIPMKYINSGSESPSMALKNPVLIVTATEVYLVATSRAPILWIQWSYSLVRPLASAHPATLPKTITCPTVYSRS